MVKLRELGCSEKWPKIFFINRYVLVSTAVSESIEQISELYGLNLGSKVALKNGQTILCQQI